MTSVEAGSYLGWLDTATNLWVNAVEGNTGNNATAAQQGYAGALRRSKASTGWSWIPTSARTERTRPQAACGRC